jgi:hypothetical protein
MLMSRRVLIALFATLTELIIIAAGGNQAVTKLIIDHPATSPLDRELEQSLLSFGWRFAPQTGASQIWFGELGRNLTVLVLTFVLVLIILRGPATFSGPFFATICAVTTAAVIGPMVESVVNYSEIGQDEHTGLGRVGFAVFNSSNGPIVVFAVLSGVVAGFVAGLVGVSVRRRSGAGSTGSTWGTGGMGGTGGIADGQVAPGMFAPGTAPSPYSTSEPFVAGGFPSGGPYDTGQFGGPPQFGATGGLSGATPEPNTQPESHSEQTSVSGWPPPATPGQGYNPTTELPEVPRSDQ